MPRAAFIALLCLLTLTARADSWEGFHGPTPQGRMLLVDLNKDPDITYPRYDFYGNGMMVDIEVQSRNPLQSQVYRRQLCRFTRDDDGTELFVCDKGETPLSGTTYRITKGEREACYPRREPLLACIDGCGPQTPRQLRHGFANECESFLPTGLLEH